MTTQVISLLHPTDPTNNALQWNVNVDVMKDSPHKVCLMFELKHWVSLRLHSEQCMAGTLHKAWQGLEVQALQEKFI